MNVNILFLLILLTLVGCGADDDRTIDNLMNNDEDSELITAGAMVYMEAQPTGNTFACAHCHAITEPASDGFTRPGHPIGDALRRETFKNEQLTSFLSAANSCLDEWMSVDAPWTDSTPDYLALTSFLASEDIGNENAPLVVSTLATPLNYNDDDELTGNAEQGQSVFNQSCAICHGQNATGSQQAPALTAGLLAPNYISNRVRLSGNANSSVYSGLTGGRMPFWTEDRLSDNELNDIISYLTNINDDDETPEEPIEEPVMGGENTCSATDASIGQTADLITRFHGVTGTATIIDDCTIEISNFHFDGGGIDVRVYGALNANYDSGFIIGENLVRSTEYAGETLRLTLPIEYTLADINSLSIWCVPIGVSFGDGAFQ